MPFWDWVDKWRDNRIFVAILLIPNLLGIIYGYYYYWEVGQFDPSSRYFRNYLLWPFISDSPNAVLLMCISLVLSAFFKIRSKILDALAFGSMVYVGCWTTLLFLLYPETMGTFAWDRFPENANPMLFVSHMGMPLEALLLVPALRKYQWPPLLWGLIIGWFWLNVGLDYAGPHIHPAPFLHDQLAQGDDALHLGSVILMVCTVALFGALTARRVKRFGDP